ncbi:MAG: BREX-1 system phosphatase PglZ type A, partial [Bacteroidales bacterium]|nr:BREX-1 system phosphatase PglZ type A [Bacteroidales bacterium]
AVVFGTDNVSLVTFIHAHGSAFTQGNDRCDKELERYNLKEYYWKEIARKYGYNSNDPSIYDFLLEIFNNNFILGKKTGIARESGLLISIWKNTLPYRECFSKISNKIAGDSGIEASLAQTSIDSIIGDELFELTDMKIIHDLVRMVTEESISGEKLQKYIKQRENKFWYEDYRYIYSAISYASEMIELIRRYPNQVYDSFNAGVDDYAKRLYLIDHLYRKFIWSHRKTLQNKILSALASKVEKVYANDWLLTFNNNWQKVIDSLDIWPLANYKSQQHFYYLNVLPSVSKGQRLFVIISDAFRYECGVELGKLILGENRFEANVDYCVSLVPSYTQLGMAALLPHTLLSFQSQSGMVLADGMSTLGALARAKILEQKAGVKATAINAEDLMKMNSATEGRDFVKKYELIYIYHNRIDKVGDDKTSEDKVFEAVEEELLFLRDLLKKITAMNGNTMIITSDHGFLYQHQPLDDSDFSMADYSGEIWKENRRFVIGKQLKGDNKTKHFSQQDTNLNAELLLPKSINRLRIKGAGSRFIHGGATLQELMIPVIKVTKKRQDTIAQVDVDIIQATDRITTNILAVSFIQNQNVSDTMMPRTLRTAIYAGDGELLSDIFNYTFNIEEESTRLREVKHRFQLSSKASGIYKNQRVKLVLQDPVEGSNKWKHYKEFYFTLNISFTSDFDEL